MEETALRWVLCLAVYFGVVPGILTCLGSLSKSGGLARKVLLGSIALPLVAAMCLLAQQVHLLGGLFLCILLACHGWWHSRARIKWDLGTLAYVGVFPASLLPITMFDAVCYQLYFPRGIHRIGLEVINPTSIHGALINSLHIFLSSFGFDDTVLNVAAIAFQAGCLALLLRLVREGAGSRPWVWQWGLLGTPLILLMAQEAWIEVSCALLFTAFFCRLSRDQIQWEEALALGLFFHFKLLLFLCALPLLFLRPVRESLRPGICLALALPMALHMAWNGWRLDHPLFPYNYALPSSGEFHESFSAFNGWVNTQVHQGRWDIPEALYGIFYMICPLLLPCMVMAVRSARTFASLAAAIVVWHVVFPQQRFAVYWIPAVLILASRNIQSRHELRVMSLLSLALFAWRGLRSETDFWHGKEVPWDLPQRALHPFARFLKNKDMIYAEGVTGWDLPGHVVGATTDQYAWSWRESWLDQMRSTGITHVIKDLNYRDFILSHSRSQDDYYSLWQRLEDKRRRQVSQVLVQCKEVSRHQGKILYALP